jgi:hypothetical protein
MLEIVWPLDAATTAAIFSAIATLFAAIATWRGPRSAAALAEALRAKSEVSNEKRRMKLFVFTTLMQERAAYYSSEAVKAFNLIDVVFNESRKVRNAWSEFHAAMDSTNRIPEHAQQERFRILLSTMADDIGLTDQLRSDDLNRTYYPTALAEEEHVKSLQRKAAINQLTQNESPAANTAPSDGSLSIASKFPPAP